MKLFIASLFTIFLLFSFLLSVLFAIFYFLGIIDFALLIMITAIIFFFQWLISPYISDILYSFFYKLEWIGIEGLKEMDKELASFVRSICNEKGIKVPKIGFIDDDNPQAFTYGSAAFNARLVFTKGVMTYLDKDERKAVFAHEIGHIVHRDFIVMTIAAFILVLFYHISTALMKTRRKRKGNAAIIGLVAYILYLIGNYILLFLSRIREYYADEFSAKVTGNADSLARALIKIAYGIIAKPESKSSMDLMKSTRVLGIADFSSAKGVGLAYIMSIQQGSLEPLQKVLLYDLKNPWAFVYEINSSHPLTAKRIRRLAKIGSVYIVDVNSLENYQVDKQRLYKNFVRDIIFNFLPQLSILMLLSSPLLIIFGVINSYILIFLLYLLGLAFGTSILLKTLYRYPEEKLEETNILNLMQDIYSSPIRGKYVKLKGKIVGRGIPGLIFSEDMIFQDETGLIYLNYEGLIPFFSNLIFSFFELEKLVGKEAEIKGWFIRGLSPRIELNNIVVEGKVYKSRIKFLGIIIGALIIFFIGSIGIYLFL